MQERLSHNVPRTLDNTREYDPSFLTAAPPEAGPSHAQSYTTLDETSLDIASDPFASYFSNAAKGGHETASKALITTSMSASKPTYDFCDELVNIIPGSEFIRRKKGKGFEMGRIASWAAGREYGTLIVINEDMKRPSEYIIPSQKIRDLRLPDQTRSPLHISLKDQLRILSSHLFNTQSRLT